MKREFVINRQGKDYVLYAGLLDEAHQQGLRAIKTQLVQAPAADNGNVAICMAEVTTDKGTFTGIGDAEPGNVNRMMANALIRMAETRAKARALRDAVNVGMVAIEELADSASEALPADDAEALLATPPPAEIVSFPGTSTRQTLRQPASPSGPEADGVRQRPAAPAAPPIPLRPGSARGGETPTAPPAAKDGEGGAARFAGARGSTTRSGGGKGADGPPLPATQTQLETIAKLARGAGRTVATEGLTRAAASELITRLSEERYGARRST